MENITVSRLRPTLALATGLLLSLIGTFAPVHHLAAQMPDRIVLINGELLDAEGLRLVDQLNCGEPVPNGNYWLDLDNRVWGHVGTGDQYPLPDCSGGGEDAPAEESDCERQHRFYEDRMCYCYGVC